MVGDANYRGAPLVDCEGNIYLSTKIYNTLNDGKYGMYCFQQDGNVRWFFRTFSSQISQERVFGIFMRTGD